jgi:hypothetical protein
MVESAFEGEGFDWALPEIDTVSSLDYETTSSSAKEIRQQGDEVVYLPGTEEYRKARKRRQNRESAARNRARKKNEVSDLEVELERLMKDNFALRLENAALKTENECLRGEQSFEAVLPVKRPKRRGEALAACVMISVACLCFLARAVEGETEREGLRMLGLGVEFQPNYGKWLLVTCGAVMWGLGLWMWGRKTKGLALV